MPWTIAIVTGGWPDCAGARLFISTGAANYSGQRFENASTFDMERDPNRLLAFGTGAHFGPIHERGVTPCPKYAAEGSEKSA